MEEYNGFLIISLGGGLREVKAKGKGSVVKALRGKYTSVLEARKAIDMQLRSKGGKHNGKAKSTN